MATDEPSSPPHPRAVYETLVEVIDLYHLSNLPRILDLFAHMQILSSQIHRQARRALKLQATLIAKLSAKGVDERDWVRYGALTKAQGERLRDLATEEYEEGIRRDDAMMELSFQLRLIKHIVTLLAKPRVALTDIENVIGMYFPLIHRPDEFEDIAAWRGYIRSSSGSRCYIRAMSSDQARRFELYRQRAEGALDRTRQEGYRLSRQDLFRDLTEEQEGLCVEEMRTLAAGVLAELEELGRIFDPSVGGEEEAAEEIDSSQDVDRDVGMDHRPVTYEQDFEEGATAGLDYLELDGEQLSVEAGSYHSPPPIRAPRSSMAPARSAPAPRSSEAARTQEAWTAHIRAAPSLPSAASGSPATARRGRPSGLPPPTGPDYTTPRAAPMSGHRQPLKPFSSNKLQNRGHTAGVNKRSRVSTGTMSTVAGCHSDERRAKMRRAHSDD